MPIDSGIDKRSGVLMASRTISRIIKTRRGVLRPARHQHACDLHAVSGRQRAGEGRALRLDGILRRGLCNTVSTAPSMGNVFSGGLPYRPLPDWRFRLDANRRGRISSKSASRSMTSWTGACWPTQLGDIVLDRIPVLTGALVIQRSSSSSTSALLPHRRAASRCTTCPARRPRRPRLSMRSADGRLPYLALSAAERGAL